MERDRSNIAHGGQPIPLAIIGLAFEFPQEATSVEAFWQMLCEGRSAGTDFPQDRLNIDAFYHPDESRPSTIPLRGGNFVLKELGAFDAPFFSITPAEAACMDPQHRRMLETGYHALEDAGISLDECSGSDTSVYTGCFTNDYLSILQQDYEAEQRHAAMGIAPSMLANRLSWFFNFKGTSMNLDSACSSSLVALHLACQDLRAGTASMALVGGANLVYHPDFMKMMSSFKFLSPDSRSWSFDQRANGYARGEGTAVIVVKRLEDALRDGNTIRTVIRSTGSSQDGRTPGITQPSQEAQMNLIERTYKQAGIDMEPTRFFETHGTGTKVGDPIEANAIGTVFRHCRKANDPLYIGAVKANIGHLEGCSGLAGIIKAVLVLEKGAIPPIAGFESLNQQIDADRLHLYFPTELIPWPKSNVRRACINSFGFGGTNAVAILDDACHYLELNGLRGYHRTQRGSTSNRATIINGDGCADHRLLNDIIPNGTELPSGALKIGSISRTAKLLVWSASEKAVVQQMSDAYRPYISQHALEIDNLAYTLAARRSHLAWRSFLIVDPCNDRASPAEFVSHEPIKAISDQRVAFIFTGQGAQYLGMGRQLFAFPMFQRSMDSSDKCLKQLGCLWSLHEIIDGRNKDMPIDSPEYSQPLTTCLQLALVDLLKSFGIVPSVVLGHSSGEIAAAYAAGALSRFSAVKVAYNRGNLSSSVAKKANDLTMMAVGLSKDDALLYLDRLKKLDGALNVAIGCINSPKSVTLTGKVGQLTTLGQWFKEDSIFARRLRVPVAYHSSFMKVIADDYHMAMGRLESGQRSGFVPMISSITRDIVTIASLSTAEYWVRNLTSTVEFEAALSKLLAQSDKKPRKQLGRTLPRDLRVTHLLEVGPHNALQGPVRESLQAFSGTKRPTYISSLIRNLDASVALLEAIGTLYCAGYPINILLANGLEDSARPTPPDLPKYPFNHKQSYWKESRLSKNFRFREFARHDLLGTRNLDWNPNMAQWRNVIRLDEVPWLGDHKINGQVIFPAAGMIVMAIEALRQLMIGTNDLRGMQIKNAAFLHPITLPPGIDKAETQLTLSTHSRPSTPSSWSQFRLFVMENDTYMECCSGFIRAVVDQQERGHLAPTILFMGGRAPGDWMNDIAEACQGLEQDLYSMSTGAAVQYGPSFQNVKHMRLGGGGEAIAEIDTDTWKLKSIEPFTQAYTVHPSILDGLAQLLVPALAQERYLPTMIPTSVASIWVNCSNTKSFQGGKLRAAAKCRLRGYRGASADIVGTSLGSCIPLLCFEGLETTFISSTESPTDKQVQPRHLCTRLVWKLDIDMMNHEQVLLECTRDRPKEPIGAVQKFKSLMVIITSFIEEAINFMEQHPSVSLERHLEAYVGWMRYQQQRLRNGESSVDQATVQHLLKDHDARERLISQVEDSGVDGYFFMHIGRNLIKVLCSEVDPLDLMFRNGLADRYYEQMLANEHHAHPASAYIDLLCFKNPSMNILEVGAGTGGQTLRVLERLSSDGINKWARYDYTDISPGFFVQARAKFRGYADQMSFRVCDISKDPISQSFEAGSYDLAIASHVLHATDDLDQSLRNLRKILKPDGRLLLFETTRPDALHIGFAFGLLKGWWRPLEHEPRCTHSPCLTPGRWDEHLRKTGFSGVDVEIPGQEEPQCQYSSIIISSAVGRVTGMTDTSQEIALIRDTQIEAQCTIAKLLEARLAACFSTCKTYMLSELAEADLLASTMTVFLVEMNATFLVGLSAGDYDHFHSILIRSKNTVWVTQANSSNIEPPHHLADGLGRSLASEDSTRKFVTLALGGLGRDPEQTADVISELVRRVAESAVENLETNYAAARDMLHINRISENGPMDKRVAEGTLPRQQGACQLTSDTRVALHLGSPGHVNTLEWMSYEEALGQSLPDNDEVVVEVRAFGLTLKDHLISSGQLNELDLGTECAGIVQAAGDQSSFLPGDRVCLVGTSTSRSTIRVKASAVTAIPSEMSFAQAASMPNALWLSYHALVDVARLQEGETVLIHQGSSSVGQMAIQLARKLGADVLVTTSSASKGEFLRCEFRVPETAIFYTEDNLLSNKIYQATHGQGVDVVMGPLTGASGADLSDCLSPFGRLVDIGVRQPLESTTSPSGNMAMNTSRASVDMVNLLKKKPVMAHRTFRHAMRTGFEAQLRPPQPLHVFQADEVEAAFRHFEDVSAIGKRVIELRPKMTIMANVQMKPKCCFPADATYVVAGGLGGLGRSFARWMASRGARSLVLLSRSGPISRAARALVNELEIQGVCVVTPQVDIGNINDLKHTLDNLAKSLAPIRGCIQATVALRDNLFENMTYEDWVVSTRSKVAGSWNLHKVLPSELDFFVLLASVNGIFGGRAQANYAAGNTFEDALAHHRIAHGQKAVSIDLGLMVTEGVVAENECLLASMRRIGHLMDIRQEELIALLDYYCDPNLPLLPDGDAQILVGIEMPSAVLAKGIDLHHSIRRPIFRHLFRMATGGSKAESCNTDSSVVDRAAVLKMTTSQEEAAALVTRWFSGRIGQVLGLPELDVDLSRPMHTYGIDSLVAIDLKNWLAREIGADIEVFVLLGNMSLETVSAMAAEKSRYR